MKSIRLAITLGLVLFVLGAVVPETTPTANAEQPGLLLSEFVYETAPFPSCHASTLVEPAAGELVAAWFGGTAEGKTDVAVWVSRRTTEGWTTPFEVANGVQADGTRFPCWNPVLFQPRPLPGADANTAVPLMLFYKVGPSPSRWWGMLRTSSDRGKTWSDATRLPEGILGPIKNKPVQLPSGEILSPTSTEHDGWRVHFERSADLGKTWTKTAPVNDGKEIGAIQPSILFVRGADPAAPKLLALGRTRQKRLFTITSEDLGKTWGTMSLSSLPNPNSGTDAVTLKDGRHLLIYNPTEKGRSPLHLALSPDAQAWQQTIVFESEPGEYSYPSMIQTADGRVHVVYTWKRQRVKHAVLDPAQLRGL